MGRDGMIWKEEGMREGGLQRKRERELERAQSTFARLKLDLTQPAFSPPPQRRIERKKARKRKKKKRTGKSAVP